MKKKITRGNESFLAIREFWSARDCISALKEEGRTIWVTSLSPESISLNDSQLRVPEKLALVIGCESEGFTSDMLLAADGKIHFPINGFTPSLGLSVASALILQKLFFLCPNARGNLTEAEKQSTREDWYSRLSKKSNTKRTQFLNCLSTPPPILADLRVPMEQKDEWVPRRIKRRVQNKEAVAKKELEHKCKKIKISEFTQETSEPQDLFSNLSKS
eukprot:TRINITY_DN599_c0_g1_i12.p1 TRINITY_DN599_c0_g1~~TRINITY_DN599_c0_g1_i12.p1  ORF type:complete len:217 (-),score=51.45 TRINITY_DN599_c0_g1_i12:157-807(-)